MIHERAGIVGLLAVLICRSRKRDFPKGDVQVKRNTYGEMRQEYINEALSLVEKVSEILYADEECVDCGNVACTCTYVKTDLCNEEEDEEE